MHRIAITCSLLLAACAGTSERVLTDTEPAPAIRLPAIGLTGGDFHSCALDRDGSAVCWGGAQDGSGDTADYLRLAATAPTGTFAMLSAGGDYTCGLRVDGSVGCAGWLHHPEYPALDLRPPPGRYLDVAAAWRFACGLQIDRTVECWGDGDAFTAPTGTFVELSARGYHMCGLRDDGTVACWGYVPPAGHFEPPPGGVFASVTAGDAFHCALDGSGAATCWRSWDGSAVVGAPAPSDRFSSIALGLSHACGIKLDGTIACWGADTYEDEVSGSGSGSGSWPAGSIAGPPAGSFVAIAAGSRHSCAIRDDGTVACWGANGLGQASPP